MERIQSINPDRIRWGCADRGVTPDQLAAATGMPASTLARTLNGEEGLTFRQLQEVARYFNRGVLFFLEPGPVNEDQLRSPQYRTLANQKPGVDPKVKALVERTERQREVFVGLREELGMSDALPFSPPLLPENDDQSAAALARAWLGLQNENDFDSYREAVENKGILVFRTNGYAGSWQVPTESPICGFSLYHEIWPVIVVRKQEAPTRQAFSLMHELGHLLLHRASMIDENQDLYSHQGREQEANAFAGQLLIPNEFLTQISDAQRPADVARFDDWLAPQRRTWGVSGEVILRRLLDVGRLSNTVYQSYREWVSNRPMPVRGGGSRYRFREPKEIFGDRFVRTVFDSLSARNITLVGASRYLDNLKIEDIHRLERLYARL
jgi:Zn-dependent peptidase ImmA (M78 family)/transcriptional regulator with XRE-family HTH domain